MAKLVQAGQDGECRLVVVGGHGRDPVAQPVPDDAGRARSVLADPGDGGRTPACLLAGAAAVESARATYLQAARLKDAGRPFSWQASIAKMVCTDNAMKVTTDAVQVLGGIQRLVISRDLARG